VIWLGVILGALGCYALKLAGLSVPDRLLRAPRVEGVAALLPVALLATLIATQTFSTGHHLTFDPRAAGLGAAATAQGFRAPFLVVVAAAAAATALLRLVV
jgi:uncharacterized membrane protein